MFAEARSVVRRTQRRSAALILLTVFASACGQDVPTVPGSVPEPTTSSAAPTQSADDAALRLDFESLVGDGGSLSSGVEVEDASGSGLEGVLHTEGAPPPALQVVPGQAPDRTAVQFPAPCEANEEACGRAIIEVVGTPELTVGAGDFEFGATLRMSPQQVSKGSNVIQRGFSVGGGGQWKLQVDGDPGHPSCVLVGSGDAAIHEARARLTVADDDWHEVVCRREGDRLDVLVDGTVEGSADLPEGLSADPEGPLRIGGKSLKPGNDQFFGVLDEVFVRLLAAP